MAEKRTIAVPLPEEFEIHPDDLDVMRATFQSIVALANRCGRNSERPCRMMEDDGWEVKWTLGWVATAQRGKEYEEASGKTRKEAMMRLREATCLHEAGGCP